MTKLYEITRDYADVLEAIAQVFEANPDLDESAKQSIISENLSSIQHNFESKAFALAGYILNLKLEQANVKELAEIKDGMYTGAMQGALLHGKEKAIAVRELALNKGLNLEDCYSYSDSHNDFPLLQCVGHPSAINPDAILSLRAMAEGWPIHDFRRARHLAKIVSPVVVRLAALGTWLTPRRKKR